MTTKGFGYDRPKANGCFYDFTPTQLPFWDSCSIPKIADSNKCRNLFGNVFTNLVIPSQGHIFPALAVEPELNGNHPIVIRFTSPGAVCSDPFSYQVVSVRVRESAYYGGSQCALARFLDTSRHQTTSHIYQSNDI